jgi:hypothetical protein
MSKRDRSKAIVNEIASVQPFAKWTLGRPRTGQIIVEGKPMDYWMPDGQPITPMLYAEKQSETVSDADEIPF